MGTVSRKQPALEVDSSEEPEVRKVSADAIPTGRFVSSAPLRIAVRINPKASSHPTEDGAAAT